LALGEDFCPRSGYRGQQPVQPAFPGYEFQLPPVRALDELVVPFGYPQDLIDRLDPSGRDTFISHGRAKRLAQRFPKSPRP